MFCPGCLSRLSETRWDVIRQHLLRCLVSAMHCPACPYLFYLERHLEEHIRLDHKELLVCGTVRYEVALINPARRTTRLLARPSARQRDKERAPRRRPAGAENKRCPAARWGPAPPAKKHKHVGARTHHPAPPLGPACP